MKHLIYKYMSVRRDILQFNNKLLSEMTSVQWLVNLTGNVTSIIYTKHHFVHHDVYKEFSYQLILDAIQLH